MSSSSSRKSKSLDETPDSSIDTPSQAEELQHTTSNNKSPRFNASVDAEDLPRPTSTRSLRCSQPIDINRTVCSLNKFDEANTVSAEYMERLILLTSKARSSHAQDDEIVDLTEPRFESFCMANAKFPQLEK